MKQFHTLLFAFLTTCPVFAQKNTVALDVRYLPVSGVTVAGASLNYYRAIGGRHSLGLKTTWNTDAVNAADFDVRTHVLSLDAVHRWNFSKKTKTNWFVEAGISGLAVTERTPPQEDLLYCPVGMTDEQIAETKNYHSSWRTESELMFGFATATSLEFLLSRRFSLGAALAANIYYSPAEKTVCPYLVPSLRTAFSF